MQENAILRNKIEESIAADPRVNGRIDVEATERHVRLSGVVDNFEAKETAEEIARSFGPVQLESDITIASSRVIEDDDVLEHVQATMAQSPDLAHDIGVGRVVNGVVYLKGHSESIARISETADRVAHVPGVKDVVSEVKIRTDVPIDDIDLRNEVVQGLHHDMGPVAEFIGVTADDGVVTLDGSVNTMALKAQASTIAKRMPGARRVVNNITVKGIETLEDIDQALEDEVLKALEAAKINMWDMRVSVLGGVVHLDGTVATIKQKDLAEAIAAAVPGVRFVQNDLVIGFHIEPKAG